MCKAIEASAAKKIEERVMERTTRLGNEVERVNRYLLLKKHENMVQVNKYTSKPANPEDKKCVKDFATAKKFGFSNTIHDKRE